MTTARLAAGLVLVLAVGCYKPSLTEGGFLCAAPPLKACPDGFICGTDQRCRRGADAGTDSSSCTSPPATPLCAEGSDGGACNPTCQSGCACGRCNVVGQAAACTVPGAKTLGQRCDPRSDDCAAGFICLTEVCGNRLGRCYRHCSRTDQCAGTICQIPIQDGNGNDTGFLTCDLAPQECDPINNGGCPDPALNCYLTSTGQTICDCPHAMGMLGEPCSLYNDCLPGLVCVSTGGAPTCTAACNQTVPGCGASACVPSGTKYGYCGQ